MPLKMNVGLSRKVGEVNYGSRGASVNFEVEVEPTLVREPDQLREKIRYLFRLAKEAVDEQLTGGGQTPPNRHENGASHNGNGGQRAKGARPATASQLRAIYGIAKSNRIDLPTRLQGEFGVSRPDDLSISQASQFIDRLKASESGGRP